MNKQGVYPRGTIDRNNRRITPCLHVNGYLANTPQEWRLARHRRYTYVTRNIILAIPKTILSPQQQ